MYFVFWITRRNKKSIPAKPFHFGVQVFFGKVDTALYLPVQIGEMFLLLSFHLLVLVPKEIIVLLLLKKYTMPKKG
ncbi:MAG: hypothetical protein EB076_08970 [Flavobacteriia bacterium]|nr:hypothetical protein [Flavobacteriia bacterium]